MPAYTTENSETRGRRQLVSTVAFFLLAVALIYLPAPAQERVASVLRATALRPFVATQEAFARARLRAAETGQLRQRLDSLVREATSRTDLAAENLRLRGLLHLSRRIGPTYRAATVVRPGTAGSESMFMVDVGAADGVTAPAAVITREGLLGVIRDAGEASAMGLDWTHPDFRASAVTLDGSATGIVESHRGDFREEDRLVLNGTPFHATLEQGVVVLTSGLGGVYPRGIPIGRVHELAEADAGWRKSYWLEPFVRPGTVLHVLVALEDAPTTPPEDLSAAWPQDSIRTPGELVELQEAREDSLGILRDSLRALRALLRPDSAGGPPTPRSASPGTPVPPAGADTTRPAASGGGGTRE